MALEKINLKRKADDEVIAAATAAYYKRADRMGQISQQPCQSRSYVSRSRGLAEVVTLRNANACFAVYRVMKDGRLRWHF